MHTSFPRLALGASTVLILVATGLGQSGSLVTFLDGSNSQDGNMFDLSSPCDVTIDGFEVYFLSTNNPPPCGATCSVNEVEVYTNTTGLTGNEMNSAAWTLVGNVQHTISVGNKMPQPLNLPVSLPVGSTVPTRGMYITSTGPTNNLTGLPNELIGYTNSAFVGQTITHGDLVFTVGTGNIYPFGGTFVPRTWNGAIHYTQNAGCTGCVSSAVNYCTPGTSTSGCQAILRVIGTPSATKKKGFIVYTSGIEGQKDGLFFYGQNGRQASPWGNGTSFQCVVPPVKRTTIRNGKGTTGLCDGWAQRDLNTDWCPTCPKNSPIPGMKMQIQFWYRDPLNTSNQTTSLSDAIEVDVCP